MGGASGSGWVHVVPLTIQYQKELPPLRVSVWRSSSVGGSSNHMLVMHTEKHVRFMQLIRKSITALFSPRMSWSCCSYHSFAGSGASVRILQARR